MKRPTSGKSRPRRKSKALIYLVDDQPLLLDLAELALRNDGYSFKKFQDPDAAIASFRRARAKPALLISDYAMGRTSGLDVIARCKEVCPELKTLLLSGTIGAEVVLRSPVKVDRFLAKPYQPETLAEIVRGLLAA